MDDAHDAPDTARGAAVDPDSTAYARHPRSHAEETGAIDAGALTALHGIGVGDETGAMTNAAGALGDALDEAGWTTEGAADATMLGEHSAAVQRLIGHMKVAHGPDMGAAFTVDSSPFVFGRGGTCEATLSDVGTSRRHVELTFDPRDNTWAIEDLGSASGTLVNGKPIDLPTPLRHGDLVQIGNTEMRFMLMPGVPSVAAGAMDEPTHHTTLTLADVEARTALDPTEVEPDTVLEPRAAGGGVNLRLIAGGLVLLLVAAGVGAGVWFGIDRVLGGDAAQSAVQVEALVRDGRRLVREAKLDKAAARLESARALLSQHGGKAPGLESLERELAFERRAEAAIRAAEKALRDGALDIMDSELGKVPDSSAFAPQKEALIARTSERRRLRSFDALQTLADEKQWDALEAAIAAHLKRWPKDSQALALRDSLDKLRHAKPKTPAAIRKARALFAAGDYVEAKNLVDAKGTSKLAVRYLDAMRVFETGIVDAARANAQKNGVRAAAAYGAMWRVGPLLGGAKWQRGYTRLQKPYGQALYLAALEHKRRGRACEAAAAAWAGKARTPGEKRLVGMWRQFEAQARAGLSRAEARRARPAEARRIAEKALCLAQPGSATHKALRRLAK